MFTNKYLLKNILTNLKEKSKKYFKKLENVAKQITFTLILKNASTPMERTVFSRAVNTV